MHTPHASWHQARANGSSNVVSSKRRVPPHDPEPKPGSLLTGNGQGASLFNMQHYPVRGLCRLCGESIKAPSFFRPFEHVGERHA